MQETYSKYYISKCNKNQEMIDSDFIIWIDLVEMYVKSRTGFYLLDLSDEMYMLYFENGVDPMTICNMVIENIPCQINHK